MKKLFSILTALFLGVGSVVLAMHVNQQDPLCTAIGHEGYTYPQGETPPEGTSPENLPADMEYAGIFEEDFECITNNKKTCHWVYNEATSKWEPCEGNYVDLR